MKLSFIKINILLFASLLFFASCKEDADELNVDNLSVENVQKSTEVDLLSDNISGIIEEVIFIEEGVPQQNRDIYESFLPECLTKTVEINGLVRTVTLDFGDGCDMPNGNHISGIITLVYERDPQAITRTINFTFTNFYFNYKNISGSGSILREWSNVNNNPQTTKNINITVIWPNGSSVHRVGEKIREWIEGVGSGTWGDNVFLITGHWTTEFPDGHINSGIVTTALRKEMACRFIVSGKIALSRNGHEGILDFGDGTCDNQAVFIDSSGEEHIIILE